MAKLGNQMSEKLKIFKNDLHFLFQNKLQPFELWEMYGFKGKLFRQRIAPLLACYVGKLLLNYHILPKASRRKFQGQVITAVAGVTI